MSNGSTFFIKQNSTLPEVKFPLTQRLREKYDITDEMMENVGVTFSMRDAETGIYRIANVEAKLIIKNVDNYFKIDDPKYILAYKFKLKQTKKSGRFFGEFKLDFIGENSCGKITLPTDDEINIIIHESQTKTTVE